MSAHSTDSGLSWAQSQHGKQYAVAGNGQVAQATAKSIQAGLNGQEPLKVSVSGPQLAKIEDLDLSDPCDVGHMAECAVSR